MKRLILTILLFSLLGCSDHTCKYYEFPSESVLLEYGELGVSIAGEFVQINKDPKLTHKGNPYYLMVTFRTDQNEMSPKYIKNINISTLQNRTIYSFNGGGFKTDWSNHSNNWFSRWVNTGLNLKHIPLIVTFDIVFEIKGKAVSKTFSVEFQPVYKEEKSNDFIDRIMSV